MDVFPKMGGTPSHHPFRTMGFSPTKTNHFWGIHGDPHFGKPPYVYTCILCPPISFTNLKCCWMNDDDDDDDDE